MFLAGGSSCRFLISSYSLGGGGGGGWGRMGFRKLFSSHTEHTALTIHPSLQGRSRINTVSFTFMNILWFFTHSCMPVAPKKISFFAEIFLSIFQSMFEGNIMLSCLSLSLSFLLLTQSLSLPSPL